MLLLKPLYVQLLTDYSRLKGRQLFEVVKIDDESKISNKNYPIHIEMLYLHQQPTMCVAFVCRASFPSSSDRMELKVETGACLECSCYQWVR